MPTVVLIVDDSQPMRELAKMTLAGVAEIVCKCSDGSEAMSAFERLRPDWILMAIDMKNVNGITATRQIIAAHPEARIMIVTDYNEGKKADDPQGLSAFFRLRYVPHNFPTNVRPQSCDRTMKSRYHLSFRSPQDLGQRCPSGRIGRVFRLAGAFRD